MFGFGNGGGGDANSGMVSMIAGMLGVTPAELQSQVEIIKSTLQYAQSALSNIQAQNKAILSNQREIMTTLNCQGKYDDGSNGSQPALPGSGDENPAA